MSETLTPNFLCFDCVWAKYDGNTQVGCAQGKIDKFSAQTEVVLYHHVDGENEKDCYKVKNRAGCVAFRTAEWPYATATDEEMNEQLAEEISLKTTVIIAVHEGDLVEDVTRKARNIVKASLGAVPERVVFVLTDNSLSPADIHLDLLDEPLGCDDYSLTRASVDRAFDVGVTLATSPWIWMINASDDIILTFLSDVNYKLNYLMERFVLVNFGSGVFTKTELFRRSGGDNAMVNDDGMTLNTFVDKINYIGENENQNYMIINSREDFYKYVN